MNKIKEKTEKKVDKKVDSKVLTKSDNKKISSFKKKNL